MTSHQTTFRMSFFKKTWMEPQRFSERDDLHNVEFSPQLPGAPDEDLPPSRVTGKHTTTERAAPPATPCAKRPTSGAPSGRSWADWEPLEVKDASAAWHTDLLDHLLLEWNDNNMLCLRHWFSTPATEEMQGTLNTPPAVPCTPVFAHFFVVLAFHP